MKNFEENRTMSIVRAELDASVDKYNLATDAIERVQLALEHKNLVQEFNELALLNAYAEFMRAEKPIVELAKAYYCDTISVKDNVHNEVIDGVMNSSITRSVNEGVKKLDLVKFIEWTEERNKSVANDKAWKVKVGAARNSIEAEWKKFFASGKDSHSMSIGKAKKALQAMFDALVFIPCENATDKNAVIANGDIAKWVLGFANERKDAKIDGNVTISGNVLSRQKWNTLLLDILHKAVTGKTYEITYGEPEEDVKGKKAKVDAETEAEEA